MTICAKNIMPSFGKSTAPWSSPSRFCSSPASAVSRRGTPIASTSAPKVAPSYRARSAPWPKARPAKLAEDGSAGYALLARFNQAALLAKSSSAAAADAYLKLSADTDIDPLFRGLATVLSVLHDLDSGDAGQMTGRLTPLLETANPWRHSAKELTALLARKSGDIKRAKELFRELTDDGSAPQGIRARAAEMSAILGR